MRFVYWHFSDSNREMRDMLGTGSYVREVRTPSLNPTSSRRSKLSVLTRDLFGNFESRLGRQWRNGCEGSNSRSEPHICIAIASLDQADNVGTAVKV